MPSFTYHGRNQKGKKVSGKLSADNQTLVAKQLIAQGIVPLSIMPNEQLTQPWWRKDIRLSRSIKREQLLVFCQQIYALIKAGVPITRGIEKIAASSKSPEMQQILQGVVQQLHAGKSFSQALRQYPQAFKPLMLSLVEVGENTGQLDQAFLSISEYVELESKTIKRFQAAIRYPLIVFFTTVMALIVINFMVIPAFTRMFANLHVKLPLATRMIMATSNFLVANWLLLLCLLIAVVILLRMYLKTEGGRLRWHKLILHLPIVGPILSDVILGRFARTFSIILSAGVPLIAGIHLVAQVLGNSYVSQGVRAMAEAISSGDNMTNSARSSGLFSDLALQMIEVGEESGSVDTMLLNMAQYYEREVDFNLNRIADLLQPLLILILGLMIFVLALGVFLPLWQMISYARG